MSGSSREDAALLAPEQRWEVLCLYREYRQPRALGRPGRPTPPEALHAIHQILSSRCVHAVLDGLPAEALLRARQHSYQLLLLQRWILRNEWDRDAMSSGVESEMTL